MRLGWFVAGLAIAASGCRSPAENEGNDGSSGSSTTQGGADGGSTDGGSAQACHALPAAAIAAWVEGPSVAPTGESTAERIRDAGGQTWDVALDLLRVTDSQNYPSVASSPTSMSLSLALAYQRFSTLEPMCSESIHAKMHYLEAEDELHNTLGASVRELRGRSLPAGPRGEDPVVVSFLQSMWELVLAETETVDVTPDPRYGATHHAVSRATSESLVAINEILNCVIEQQSQGLLVDFIPPGIPDEDSASFDIDVAFLQAPWPVAWEPDGALPFTRDDGQVVGLDAMTSSDVSPSSYEGEAFFAVELPLRGDDLGVMFVLPNRDVHPDLDALVGALTAVDLETAREVATPVFADVRMPIVDIPATTIDYFEPLAFACTPYLSLRRVLHGATVQIDEHGIKAAAATVAEGGLDGSGGVAQEVIILDRPFLFFVYDRRTQFVLYSGRFAG